jgi:1-acyl-sn-glycerol-3-phosphate acyltransferase
MFLSLVVLVFLFVVICCACVDMKKVQEKDSPFYRFVLSLCADAIHSILMMKVEVQGAEKMPKEGRIMLVCNHLHLLDPVVLLHIFRDKQLGFISKKENDRKFIIGPLLHKTMCQPINRENDREALKTILNCVKLLNEDEVSIGAFPEGYTSKDNLLHPFRHGVFKVAQKAQVPIVICTLRNTHKAFHNILRLKPTKVELHVVDVITPEAMKGQTTVQIGTKVYEMMAADLGPALVAPISD